MTMLKIKAIIYRYLGVFLAEKEEAEYIKSKDFWKEFDKISSHPENDIPSIGIQRILIGSWQANHGFYRPISKYWLKRSRFWRVVDWLIVCFTVLKWDIKDLYKAIIKKIVKV